MKNRAESGISITQASGVTPSERYLAQLARRTFLSLWSHPNLFTDEGRKNGAGDGKELCDSIVIFDNHVILFSDKHCSFPEHTDMKVAWGRWYRRAVEKSANQLFGAQAWLWRFPNRVFLDSGCSHPFPLPIPDLKRAKFHRVAVTRGAYEKCEQFFGGNGTGSFKVDTGIKGTDHLVNPFTIGQVAPLRGYIHVWDELTLEVVLRELDTISDLVKYLQKKEELLTQSGRVIMATGEEQLVAMYLTHTNEEGEHDFLDIPEDIDAVMIAEGYWEDLISNPQYIAKKQADEVSYTWDRLIEHFIAHRGDKVGEFQPRSLTDIETVLRVLASESRLSRRVLSRNLLDALNKKVPPGQRFIRFGTSIQSPAIGYLFLILPKPPYVASYEEYREGRMATLLACCKVAKLRVPEVHRIMGIATEPYGTVGASEDLVLLETYGNDWTPQQEQEAKDLQANVGIFEEETTRYRDTHDTEYPYVSDRGSPKTLNRAERRRVERQRRRTEKKRHER